MSSPALSSYAQRYEDLYLLHALGDRPAGFYIDVGGGHPVFDNVSFAFYQRGWRGIAVEPNPALARLSRAVRPRDVTIEAVVGTAPGETEFYLVREFHGFSSVLESNAQSARAQFGKGADAIRVPVTTLAALCAAHAPATIDFLKVDVEGAEPDVLSGADWTRFRPRIVVVEALAPFSLAPAWDAWEPILLRNRYGYAFFDGLNRYYVAAEAEDLARRFDSAPPFDAVPKFRDVGPALETDAHPDGRLAALAARGAMLRMPLLSQDLLVDLLTAELPAEDLGRPAAAADLSAAWERLFGRAPSEDEARGLAVPAGATVRDLYGEIVGGDAFRAAAGRISASYAW